MPRRTLLVPALLLVAAAGLAIAQPGGGRPGGNVPGIPGGAQPGAQPGGQPGFNPQQFIDRLMQSDANGDGKLSRDEVPGQLANRFDNIDANTDGFLDRAELESAMSAVGPGGGGRGGMGRLPLGRAMENAEDAFHALEESPMNAESLATDLERCQALQEALVAAKFHSATMRFGAEVLEHFEGDEAEARMEFREHMIEAIDLALDLEVALMDGDAEAARDILEQLEEVEHHSHEEFQGE